MKRAKTAFGLFSLLATVLTINPDGAWAQELQDNDLLVTNPFGVHWIHTGDAYTSTPKVTWFAENLNNPSGICMDPNGDIFVSERMPAGRGRIVKIYDGNAMSGTMEVVAAGFPRANDLACPDADEFVFTAGGAPPALWTISAGWSISSGGEITTPVSTSELGALLPSDNDGWYVSTPSPSQIFKINGSSVMTYAEGRSGMNMSFPGFSQMAEYDGHLFVASTQGPAGAPGGLFEFTDGGTISAAGWQVPNATGVTTGEDYFYLATFQGATGAILMADAPSSGFQISPPNLITLAENLPMSFTARMLLIGDGGSGEGSGPPASGGSRKDDDGGCRAVDGHWLALGAAVLLLPLLFVRRRHDEEE